jgi:hypothetical protein
MTSDKDDEIAELRARLSALESKPGANPEPDTAHSAAPPLRKSNKAVGCLVIIGALLLLGWCAGQIGGSPAIVGADDDLKSAGTDNGATRGIASAAATGSRWQYSDDRDPMTDRLTRLACTTSSNKVQQDFPYDDVNAEMCLRQSPRHGLDVYVRLKGDGQILCRSYRNCTVKVRFDDGAVQSFSAADAADGSSNIIFITNVQRFAAAVKDAEKTRIELTLYQAGVQPVEFETADLEWPRPAAP